jgi:hypothetical protein
MIELKQPRCRRFHVKTSDCEKYPRHESEAAAGAFWRRRWSDTRLARKTSSGGWLAARISDFSVSGCKAALIALNWCFKCIRA